MNILMKLLHAVMDRDLPLGKQSLEIQLIYLSKATGLRQRKALLLEQCQCQFPLQLSLAEMSGCEDFVGNCEGHIALRKHFLMQHDTAIIFFQITRLALGGRFRVFPLVRGADVRHGGAHYRE